MEKVTRSTLIKDKIFLIPEYQREYSWELENLKDFLQDIEQSNGQHIMGSILVVDATKESAEKRLDDIQFTEQDGLMIEETATATPIKVYEVIDGQQRITTLFICLVALMDTLKDKPFAKMIESEIYPEIMNHQLKEFKKIPALIQNIDYKLTKDFFTKPTIGQRKSVKLMIEAYEFFRGKFLKKEPDPEKFLRQLNKCCVFWWQKLESDFQANIVFECQNNRGVPLTELDKLKNHLIFKVSTSDASDTRKLEVLSEIKASWKSIFMSLSSRGIYDRGCEDKILSITVKILYDETESKSLLCIKNILSNHSGDELLHQISYLVNHLSRFSKVYSEIESPERQDGHYFLPLKELQITYPSNFVPILMAAKLKFSESDFYSVCDLVRDAAFWVYGVFDKKTNYGNNDIYRLAVEIYMSESVDGEKSQANKKILYKKINNFDEFKERFIETFIIRAAKKSTSEDLHKDMMIKSSDSFVLKKAIVYAFEVEKGSAERCFFLKKEKDKFSKDKFSLDQYFQKDYFENLAKNPKFGNPKKNKKREEEIDSLFNRTANNYYKGGYSEGLLKKILLNTEHPDFLKMKEKIYEEYDDYQYQIESAALAFYRAGDYFEIEED